jgi:hypothetical protein
MAKKLSFLTQNEAKLYKHLILTFVFESNAIFAENWRKSQKTVIITSASDLTNSLQELFCSTFLPLLSRLSLYSSSVNGKKQCHDYVLWAQRQLVRRQLVRRQLVRRQLVGQQLAQYQLVRRQLVRPTTRPLVRLG